MDSGSELDYSGTEADVDHSDAAMSDAASEQGSDSSRGADDESDTGTDSDVEDDERQLPQAALSGEATAAPDAGDAADAARAGSLAGPFEPVGAGDGSAGVVPVTASQQPPGQHFL